MNRWDGARRARRLLSARESRRVADTVSRKAGMHAITIAFTLGLYAEDREALARLTDEVSRTTDGVAVRGETVAAGLDVPWLPAFGPDGVIYFCTSSRDARHKGVEDDDRILRLIPVRNEPMDGDPPVVNDLPYGH